MKVLSLWQCIFLFETGDDDEFGMESNKDDENM